jgi:hypothetical protein
VSELFSLVYSSTATRPFDDDDLAALLESSRRSNTAVEITGVLLYRGGRFIQFLEGPESEVRTLMARITEDSRHTNVRVLLDGHGPHRQFAEWSMGYEPIQMPAGPPPAGFRDTFDDIDRLDDRNAVVRAARELSLWFRRRSDPPG